MIYVARPHEISSPELQQAALDSDKVMKVGALRHPDASLVARLEVLDPRLQIRGSWKKIHTPKHNKISPRMGFTHFVWHSELSAFAFHPAFDM